MIQHAALALLFGVVFSGGAAEADVEGNIWFEQGQQAVQAARSLAAPPVHAHNVILFVGDGMGVPTVTAARILQGQLENQTGEENALSFEQFPWLALAKTYNTNQQIPDSAGTITAILSGVKTKAGVIGVNEAVVRGDAQTVAANRVPTLFEQAEERGLATGIVTTTRVTHATPAGAYGHVPERNWEQDSSLPSAAREAGFPDLAQQLLAFPNGSSRGLDVVLGGGRRAFLPAQAPVGGSTGTRADGRNLIAEWQAGNPNRTYVSDLSQLQAVDTEQGRQVLGLFSGSHMSFEADREKAGGDEPSLAQMTVAAIDLLKTHPQGYLLLVEGGRIDHAHHDNNAYRALIDTLAFDDAVEQAVARTNPEETLILVTADHGHPISTSGYPTRGNPILGEVVENDETGVPRSKPALDLRGRPFTSLSYAAGPGFGTHTGPSHEEETPHQTASTEHASPDPAQDSAVDPLTPDYRQDATRPLSYGTHSGEDVPIYARGPGANLFRGVVEQNYIYHAIAEALGWNQSTQPETKP